jgi:hypothetical protein
MSDDAKPHLSVTQLSLLTKCGVAYSRRYIDRDRTPGQFRQLRGRSVHKAAEINFRQKVETARDLPEKEMVEIAVETLKQEVQSGVSLDAEEGAAGFNAALRRSVDLTADLAAAHRSLQAPHYRPDREPERTIRIELPGPRDFVGVLDVGTAAIPVVDLKNGKKSRTQIEVDRDLQMTGYAALSLQETGEIPKRLVVDQLITGADSISRKAIETTRDESDIIILGNIIDAANRAIDTGSFLPSIPGRDWWCSPTWCEYWSTCPFVPKGRGSQAQFEE